MDDVVGVGVPVKVPDTDGVCESDALGGGVLKGVGELVGVSVGEGEFVDVADGDAVLEGIDGGEGSATLQLYVKLHAKSLFPQRARRQHGVSKQVTGPKVAVFWLPCGHDATAIGFGLGPAQSVTPENISNDQMSLPVKPPVFCAVKVATAFALSPEQLTSGHASPPAGSLLPTLVPVGALHCALDRVTTKPASSRLTIPAEAPPYSRVARILRKLFLKVRRAMIGSHERSAR